MIHKAAAILTEEFLDQKQVRHIIINALLKSITEKLALKKFYHSRQNKPIGNPSLSYFSGVEIIQCYEWSFELLLTSRKFAKKLCFISIGLKHKKSFKWVYNTYGFDIKVAVGD